MDLKDLTPKSNTIEVELRHPSTGERLFNKDETPMVISVYGPYSKEYKKALYENTKGKITEGQSSLDIVEMEELNIKVLAEATVSWNITFDGKNPELSKELAAEIYEEVFWIRSQIDEAVQKSLDFMNA